MRARASYLPKLLDLAAPATPSAAAEQNVNKAPPPIPANSSMVDFLALRVLQIYTLIDF